MKVKEITIEFKRTQNLGNYSNVTIGTILNAELEEGDEVEASQLILLTKAKEVVDNAITIEKEKKNPSF